MPWWERTAIVAGVLLLSLLVAGLVERRMMRHELGPGTVTRYRVLRRTITATIVVIGLLSALLVVPQVRAVAAGILASSAVIGVVLGFAAQRTIGNAIAGLLIAFSQPVRIGDEVQVGEDAGTVEEIHLTYTFIRTRDNTRLVIPNEKLASDTIRNATIVDRGQVAEVSVQVPVNSDLDRLIELLGAGADDAPDVAVTALDASSATLVLRARARDEREAERLEQDLRLRAQRTLREAGVFA